MILYHGTNKDNKDTILKDGFEVGYGEYGDCIYLARDKDLAYNYGDEIIESFVDDEYIVFIDRDEVNDRIEIENMAQKNDIKAICVTYKNSTYNCKIDYSEICVYDPSIIEIYNK